MFYQVLGKVN